MPETQCFDMCMAKAAKQVLHVCFNMMQLNPFQFKYGGFFRSLCSFSFLEFGSSVDAVVFEYLRGIGHVPL